MKIQFKLILVGFVVIAVLMAVVGVVGIRATQEVSEKFDTIADETAPALLALGKIQASVTRINTEATNFTLINAELALTEGGAAAAAAELNEFLEAKEELEKWEDTYAEVANDSEEQQFVKDIEVAEVGLFNAAQKLIDMSRSGIKGTAILEQRDRIGEAEERFDEIITKAIAVEVAELKEQDEAADAAAAAAGRILIVGVIAAVLLALGMGVFVSRSVAKPLSKLRDAAVEIAQGNMDVKINISGKDEIGQLAQAFEKMRVSLKVVMEEYKKKKQ